MLAQSLLLPADPMAVVMGKLKTAGVDEHFADEYEWACLNDVPVGLYDHDAAVDGHFVLGKSTGVLDNAVVKGWMLKPSAYLRFAHDASTQNISLFVSPQQYASAHALPGWHALFAEHTSAAAWSYDEALPDTSSLPAGPGVLKDWVKTIKHNDAARVVDDIHDTECLQQVADAYLAERSDSFTGGFVVRAWENLDGLEWRTWWVNGRCQSICGHPDQNGQSPTQTPPTDLIEPLAAQFAHPFFTVDYAQREDGTWRIVEIGDGQVSDRPRGAEYVEAVLGPLFHEQ